MTRVSVIVPCRNEASHIDAFLYSLSQQRLDEGWSLEVVVADGMSDDGTRERLAARREAMAALIVVDNPRLIVSAGLNAAIARATGEVVVRMDVHTTYADDYVAACVRTLTATGATCVGGAWRPISTPGFQRAVAQAFESRFGSGGALSRRTDYTGPVDSVYLGAWKRDALTRLGGFDEELVRNQDDELNLRIWRAGGSVWQSKDIRSFYSPRSSPSALFSQFYQYGYWKVPVIMKHRRPGSARHLAPFVLVGSVTLLALLGFVWPVMAAAGVSVALVYGIALFAAARSTPKPRHIGLVMFALACMHIGYGVGFGHGLLDWVILRRAPGSAVTRLTR